METIQTGSPEPWPLPSPLMAIGPVGCGKSTLLAALELAPKEVKKTEALVYNQTLSIDTPGEMFVIPRFYNALILNSSRAALVLMVIDGRNPIWLPAKFSLTLRAPVVGVITKIDLADAASLLKAELALTTAGVKQIFKISAVTGEGLLSFKQGLSQFAAAKELLEIEHRNK